MTATPLYVVVTDVSYPVNPDAPAETWEWREVTAGEVVDDIPAVSCAWLLDLGAIVPAGRDRHKLAADFPARDALNAAGYRTYADVERGVDGIDALPGIGPKTMQAIRDALVAHAAGDGASVPGDDAPLDEDAGA